MLPRQLLLTLLVPLLLIALGTLGYRLLEPDLDLFECLYLTVITLTTIGYGDVYPKTVGGRVFTMALVGSGVFSLFYAMTALIRSVVSGEVASILGKRHMERALAQLKDHLIICGYGRMGKLVAREFAKSKLPFVVIDLREGPLQNFQYPNGIALAGDAADDQILRKAGIERARALVTVMASDADNLFTTMTARLLNSKLFIVARQDDPQTEQKLLRAGANRVVSPYQIGGTRVAQAILRPTVVDFIELATRTEHIDLQMEEARIAPHSQLNGCRLEDSGLRADLKIIIVAIKKTAGHMIFNPAPQTVIEAGDILVAIGHRDQLDQLAQLANAPKETVP